MSKCQLCQDQDQQATKESHLEQKEPHERESGNAAEAPHTRQQQ